MRYLYEGNFVNWDGNITSIDHQNIKNFFPEYTKEWKGEDLKYRSILLFTNEQGFR